MLWEILHSALAFKVTREPVLREADEARGISALVADLGVRGVWQPQAEALFDICVIDTDAQSHAHRSVNATGSPCFFYPFHVDGGQSDGTGSFDLFCNGSLEHFPLSAANPMVW